MDPIAKIKMPIPSSPNSPGVVPYGTQGGVAPVSPLGMRLDQNQTTASSLSTLLEAVRTQASEAIGRAVADQNRRLVGKEAEVKIAPPEQLPFRRFEIRELAAQLDQLYTARGHTFLLEFDRKTGTIATTPESQERISLFGKKATEVVAAPPDKRAALVAEMESLRYQLAGGPAEAPSNAGPAAEVDRMTGWLADLQKEAAAAPPETQTGILLNIEELQQERYNVKEITAMVGKVQQNLLEYGVPRDPALRKKLDTFKELLAEVPDTAPCNMGRLRIELAQVRYELANGPTQAPSLLPVGKTHAALSEDLSDLRNEIAQAPPKEVALLVAQAHEIQFHRQAVTKIEFTVTRVQEVLQKYGASTRPGMQAKFDALKKLVDATPQKDAANIHVHAKEISQLANEILWASK